MLLTPGTRLGRYEIVSLLGAGGMGEVYRARDANLKRDVLARLKDRADCMPWVRFDPKLAKLGDDPRFQDLLSRLGLPK